MINNKYAVGHRYGLANCPTISDGIIEITDVTEHRIFAKIIKGIDEYHGSINFQEGSIFEKHLHHIATGGEVN